MVPRNRLARFWHATATSGYVQAELHINLKRQDSAVRTEVIAVAPLTVYALIMAATCLLGNLRESPGICY